MSAQERIATGKKTRAVLGKIDAAAARAPSVYAIRLSEDGDDLIVL